MMMARMMMRLRRKPRPKDELLDEQTTKDFMDQAESKIMRTFMERWDRLGDLMHGADSIVQDWEAVEDRAWQAYLKLLDGRSSPPPVHEAREFARTFLRESAKLRSEILVDIKAEWDAAAARGVRDGGETAGKGRGDDPEGTFGGGEETESR